MLFKKVKRNADERIFISETNVPAPFDKKSLLISNMAKTNENIMDRAKRPDAP